MFNLLLLCCLFSLAVRSASYEPDSAFHEKIQKILQAEALWEKNFGQYVKNDLGYKNFRRTHTHIKDVVGASPSNCTDIIHYTICEAFSGIRCATCHAMALNTTVPTDIFSEALQQCQDAEIYQVFVAVDSYYQGEAPTQNSLLLKNTAQKILNNRDSLFHQQFSWVQLWWRSRDTLLSCIESDIPKFSLYHCAEYHYGLHHLEPSDLAKYAPNLIPTLSTIKNHKHFYSILRDSLPFDPKKAGLLSAFGALSTAYLQAAQSSFKASYTDTETLQKDCSALVDAIWNFFQALNTRITPSQWDSLCVSALHEHYCVECAHKQNCDWLISVFAFRELHQSPQDSLTTADYFLKFHAPFIFKKHTAIVDNICQVLEGRTTHAQQHQIFTLYKDPFRFGIQACVSERNNALTGLCSIRCEILLEMMSKSPESSDWKMLYTTCFPAEKRALAMQALFSLPQHDPRRHFLTNISLLDETCDLERFSFTLFSVRLPKGWKYL